MTESVREKDLDVHSLTLVFWIEAATQQKSFPSVTVVTSEVV